MINGGVIGSGAAQKFSAVRWGVAGNIVTAWALTLPAAGLAGAAVFGFTRIFGHGVAGPLVVLIAGLAMLATITVRLMSRRIPEATSPWIFAAPVITGETLWKLIVGARSRVLASRSTFSSADLLHRPGVRHAAGRPSGCGGAVPRRLASGAARCGCAGRVRADPDGGQVKVSPRHPARTILRAWLRLSQSASRASVVNQVRWELLVSAPSVPGRRCAPRGAGRAPDPDRARGATPAEHARVLRGAMVHPARSALCPCLSWRSSSVRSGRRSASSATTTRRWSPD